MAKTCPNCGNNCGAFGATMIKCPKCGTAMCTKCARHVWHGMHVRCPFCNQVINPGKDKIK